jgi:hypothetical protein
MTGYEIASEQQAPDRRDDCCEQNTDGFFAMKEKAIEQFESTGKIARSDRISELEDCADVRNRNQQTYILLRDRASFRTEVKVKFVELGIDLAPVAPGHQRD